MSAAVVITLIVLVTAGILGLFFVSARNWGRRVEAAQVAAENAWASAERAWASAEAAQVAAERVIAWPGFDLDAVKAAGDRAELAVRADQLTRAPRSQRGRRLAVAA